MEESGAMWISVGISQEFVDKVFCLNFQAEGAENLVTKPLPRPNFTIQ